MIHVACNNYPSQNKDIRIAKMLLDHGADANAVSNILHVYFYILNFTI